MNHILYRVVVFLIAVGWHQGCGVLHADVRCIEGYIRGRKWELSQTTVNSGQGRVLLFPGS